MSHVSHHEMQLLKRLLLLFVGFAVRLGFGGLVVYGVASFASYVGSVPKELGAALVAGATTIIVATVTVMIGRHFERKKRLDALYRDKKTEIYEEFLKVFFQVWFSGGKTEEGKEDPDLVSTFREFSVKLILGAVLRLLKPSQSGRSSWPKAMPMHRQSSRPKSF